MPTSSTIALPSLQRYQTQTVPQDIAYSYTHLSRVQSLRVNAKNLHIYLVVVTVLLLS